MPVPPAVPVVETDAAWTCLLPRSVDAPGLARTAVRAVLAGWGLVGDGSGRGVGDAILLVVSELVTNSVVHGSTAAVLQLARDEAGVRVSVSDSDPRTPVPTPVGPEAEGGRGLLLVDAFAHDWGTHGTAHGKVVWARLDLAVVG